ncbi:MAG: cell division protein FtsQ/DivIB [Candidatus Coproplasma sp.]
MKFLRKVLAACLAIVFLIALVIGAGIILSVQNVNVSFVYYGDNVHEAEYAQTRANLDKLKGSGLLFIDDKDIESKIADSDVLTVESYTKVYPCSIDIVIRERAETFAIASEDGQSFNIYDECGKVMKTGASTINGVDGCPNVLVSGLTVEDMGEVAQMGRYFKEVFSSFRRLVEKVTVVGVSESRAFEFVFRSGFVIRVHGYKGAEDNKLKIEKAFEKYSSLSDSQKIDGVIDVIAGKDGGMPTVVYPGYAGFNLN